MQDGLEVGKLAGFLVGNRERGDQAGADGGGNLGLEADVGAGSGEEVEHGALEGGGGGVGAGGELGRDFEDGGPLGDAVFDPFVLWHVSVGLERFGHGKVGEKDEDGTGRTSMLERPVSALRGVPFALSSL